jgi:PTH1 family peptidyl-tRNA hydrolase
MRKQELAVLDEVLDRAKSAVEMVLTQGVSAAMSEFNRRPADPEDGTDDSKDK